MQEFKLLSLGWWLVTIQLPLDHIPEVFKGVRAWSLGWPCQGIDLVVLHPQLDWPSWVAGALSYSKKTVLSVRGHCQNRRKPVLAQDNFVCGFSDASFARMNLTDFSLAEAPSDHHRFSAKFHSRCKTLQFVDLSRSLANHWMTRCWIRCEIWPRIGDNLRMLQQGLNWADSSSRTARHWSHIQSYLGPKLVSFCSDNAPERWGLFFLE